MLMKEVISFRALLLVAALLAPLGAQDKGGESCVPAPAEAATEAATEAVQPALIGLIGASVTAGFSDPRPRADGERNRTVPLIKVARALWPDRRIGLRDSSDVLTFMRPVAKQGVKLERLAAEEPSLLLGVDFMFWFGYGRMPYGDDEELARLAAQRLGKELLARFDCPVIVGDYADMRGADPQMLGRSQIPSPEVLAVLNEQLREWAGANEQVHIFPLAAYVAELKGDGVEVEYDGERVTLSSEQLLQADRLHATRLGMAVLGTRLAAFLREVLPEDHPLRPAQPSFEALVDAIGAGDDLEEVLDEARAKAKAEARAERQPAEAR